MTYKLNLENCSQRYYLAKFILKTAIFLITNIDSFLTQHFYNSRVLKNNFPDSKSNSNFCKKEFNSQFYNNTQNTIKYSLMLNKSKLSTSFFDENLNLNLNLNHTIIYYLKSFNWNNIIKNSVIYQIIFYF